MLDINLIRTNTKQVETALKKKGYDISFDNLLQMDENRRRLINEVEKLKAEKNKVSAQIPQLKKEGKSVEGIFASMRELGERILQSDEQINSLDRQITDFLLAVPNMPDEDLKSGEKEGNEVIKEFGKKPEFDFEIKNHVDLCLMHKLIDYERGVKLAGSGNWIYRGVGARLEWALLNYFISEHLKDGYEFVMVPHMLNYDCGKGAGQFPKFADEVYWIEEEKRSKFMLPTAETALVNMFSNEILDESDLPIKLCAYTPCYRKEAGSYRQEERGMIRGHQFNKIEMVHYAHPDNSMRSFEELTEKAARLVEGLGLHFRISKLAAGDCSPSMARTNDIEVWIPSMGIYKEVSSVSNANEYQARRNNTRFKDSVSKKTRFVHTLNGSGLATSRILPAIVEQNQNLDKSITVPEVLVPFVGMDKIILK